MSKKLKSILVAIFFVGAFLCIIRGINSYSSSTNKNTFIGCWVDLETSPKKMLLFSEEYLAYKGAGRNNYQIHLIASESGEVLANTSYKVSSFQHVSVKFRSNTKLWIQVNEEWTCLDYSTLEEVYDQESFFEEILATHPNINSIYSIQWNESKLSFEIENNQGEKFDIDPLTFEGKSKKMPKLFALNSQSELGQIGLYEIPKTSNKEPELITVETFNKNETAPVYEDWMGLEDKLQLDKGFAKNYAVITADSTCINLDGDKRRVLRQLVSVEDSLEWKKITDRIWLNGQLLRPIKERGNLPDSRCVITANGNAFVFYHTSLSEKEDECKLAAVDYKSGEIKWDISLQDLEVETSAIPEQNLMVGELIISLWINDVNEFLISAIEAETGVVRWSFTD